MEALEDVDGRTRLDLKVVAGAPRTEFPSSYDEWRERVVAKVAAPAKDGEANRELLEAAEEFFGLGKGEVILLRGNRSNKKTLEMVLPFDRAREILIDGLEDERG